MSKPFEVNVGSKYGAPMGRQSDDIPKGTKVHLQLIPLVDDCYDPGGAYWGSWNSVQGHMYCAWHSIHGAIYLRGRDREHAKSQLNGLKFYR